jgi:hypothetical protein
MPDRPALPDRGQARRKPPAAAGPSRVIAKKSVIVAKNPDSTPCGNNSPSNAPHPPRRKSVPRISAAGTMATRAQKHISAAEWSAPSADRPWASVQTAQEAVAQRNNRCPRQAPPRASASHLPIASAPARIRPGPRARLPRGAAPSPIQVNSATKKASIAGVNTPGSAIGAKPRGREQHDRHTAKADDRQRRAAPLAIGGPEPAPDQRRQEKDRPRGEPQKPPFERAKAWVTAARATTRRAARMAMVRISAAQASAGARASRCTMPRRGRRMSRNGDGSARPRPRPRPGFRPVRSAGHRAAACTTPPPAVPRHAV